MSWKVILWIVLGYFAFRFVFRFLLPLFVVSRKMRQQVKQFHNAMNTQQQETARQQQQQQSASSAYNAQAPKEKAGEYIDFEEVK